jgi:hypothetical protein
MFPPAPVLIARQLWSFVLPPPYTTVAFVRRKRPSAGFNAPLDEHDSSVCYRKGRYGTCGIPAGALSFRVVFLSICLPCMVFKHVLGDKPSQILDSCFSDPARLSRSNHGDNHHRRGCTRERRLYIQDRASFERRKTGPRIWIFDANTPVYI